MRALANSSKSSELDAGLGKDHDNVPDELVWRTWLFDPSALGQVYVTVFSLVLPVILAVPETTRSLVVVVPVAVMVSDSTFFALLVMSPIPLVLVGGSWMTVGVIRERLRKSDLRLASSDFNMFKSDKEA